MRLSASFFFTSGLFKKVRLSGDKKNIYMLCPACGEDEFGISLKDGHRFGCFRSKCCGFKGSVQRLLSQLGITQAQVKPYIISGTSDFSTLTKYRKPEEAEKKRRLPLWYEQGGGTSTEALHCEQYLNRRLGNGLSSDIEWGYSAEYKDYIIFPIRDSNKRLINWNARAIKEEALSRYRLGYESTDTIYGMHEPVRGDTVILVEGMFDKFNVDGWIKDRSVRGVFCLSSLGSFMSKEKIETVLSTKARKVVLWFERDNKAMHKKFYSNLKSLSNFFIVSYSSFYNSDPGDCDYGELDKRWAEQIGSHNYFERNFVNLI